MRNLKYAFRRLYKAPLFTLTAVICLGLGIGANTSIFSAVNAILLRSLPFDHVERVTFLSDVIDMPGSGPTQVSVSAANFATIRERNQVFDSAGALVTRNFIILGKDAPPERIQGAAVTRDWLHAVGIEPALGRAFLAEEDQPNNPARVVLLGYGLWQRRFGGDDHVLGQSLVLNDESYTIIGVLPKGVQFPYQAELWTPLGLDPFERRPGPQHFLGVFARMKPGVTREQVQADLDAISRQLAEERPDTNTGWTFSVRMMRDELLQGMQPRLLALLAAVGFLLFIACANVANMTLARAQGLTGEFTLRLALGAERKAVVRQQLTESVLIALIGGALGLAVAVFAVKPMIALSPVSTMNSFFQNVGIEWPVLAFTLLVSIAVGVLSGLIPALRLSKPDLQSTLKEGGQRAGGGLRGRRLLGLLVISEVALAVVLLIGAGLMIESFRRLEGESPGFDPENLLTMRVDLPQNRYQDVEERRAFFKTVLERIEALPGVESAGTSSGFPLTYLEGPQVIAAGTVEGRPLANPKEFLILNHRVVSPGYLQTLGIPLVEGRYFSDEDHSGSPPVVIVSREAARRYWPGESALGKRMKRGGPDSELPWMSVVGVVENVADKGLGDDASDVGPTWYLPVGQHPYEVPFLAVRTSVQPTSLVNPVKSAIHSLDPDQPVFEVGTMRQRLDESIKTRRFSTLLLMIFGLVGLTLAAVGIYGVMAYSVSQRTQEIGIRMAMGAKASDVLKLVLRQGMTMTGLGLAIGLAGALVLSRLITTMLYEVNPTRVPTYVVIAAVLLAVSFLACFVPARRATRVDPIRILRYE